MKKSKLLNSWSQSALNLRHIEKAAQAPAAKRKLRIIKE
jgi:hypothetical protein